MAKISDGSYILDFIVIRHIGAYEGKYFCKDCGKQSKKIMGINHDRYCPVGNAIGRAFMIKRDIEANRKGEK